VDRSFRSYAHSRQVYSQPDCWSWRFCLARNRIFGVKQLVNPDSGGIRHKTGKTHTLVLLVMMVYGALDEYTQQFFGRSTELKDWLTDTTATVVSLILWETILFLVQRTTRTKISRNEWIFGSFPGYDAQLWGRNHRIQEVSFSIGNLSKLSLNQLFQTVPLSLTSDNPGTMP